eukprot:c3453_g1_i2.p1 GENE.c3453_g1_i2~~c3453_g1_i2.p1  ORF type:complete len:114 (+),score=14.26 c3453_g1_i2:42-344(+)
MVATGIAVGKNKGHVTTKRELAPRPASRKGRKSKHTTFVRKLVREVTGYTPYEKRCMELLKIGKEKRVLRFLNDRLGSIRRAKAKREELSEIVRTLRFAK